MNFEETTWVDNESGKNLEALLFDIPQNLQSLSVPQVVSKSKHVGASILIRNPGNDRNVTAMPRTSSKMSKKNKFMGQVRPETKKAIPEQCNKQYQTSNTQKSTKCKKTAKQAVKQAQKKLVPRETPTIDPHIDKQKERTDVEMDIPNSCTAIGETYNAPHYGNNKQEDNTNIKGKVDAQKLRNARWRKRALSNLIHGCNTLEAGQPQSVSNSFAEDDLTRNKRRKMSEVSGIDDVQGLQVKRPKPPAKSRSAALNEAVTSKLKAAQFRFINEQLYRRSSVEAKKLFAKENNLFNIYHDGYTQQISRWPINPLDSIIDFIQHKPPSWVIGDFGCGDARLAGSVKNKVYSYDLVASNKRVTVADIAHVPLPKETLDVVVLCLSLMGTNYVDYLSEANRTLKSKGILLIAEIESRFKNIMKFKSLMKSMGFKLRKEEKNSYFVSFNFMKIRSPNREIKTAPGLLRPCVYKKR